jgi:hypothetical protein
MDTMWGCNFERFPQAEFSVGFKMDSMIAEIRYSWVWFDFVFLELKQKDSMQKNE